MRVYGFTDNDIYHGEMQAEEIDTDSAYYGMEAVADRFGWEYATTSIADAKRELIERMREDGADKESIAAVRSFKAYFFD